MATLEQLIAHFSNENLEEFFRNRIHSFSPENYLLDFMIDEESKFEPPHKIGHAALEDGNELLIFTCQYKDELSHRSVKKQQFEIAKKAIKEEFKDAAIFVFYDPEGNFRLSLIRRYYGSDRKYSNWKRFTYYVQPGKQNKTFKRQLGECDFRSLDEIEKAFNVETLSKDFYTELSHWYFASLNEVEFPIPRDEEQHQVNSLAMIRLITRMMFVWFMKQKGLIPDEIFDRGHLAEMLNNQDPTGSTYYKAILQNLFFATLNTSKETKGRSFLKEYRGQSNQRGVSNYYRYPDYFDNSEEFIRLMDSVPFLNGGLFENLDVRDDDNNIIRMIDGFSNRRKNRMLLTVPDSLFFGSRIADLSSYFDDERKNSVEISGLIDLLQRYDFTIDENSPDDQEVALDPELLGTVFENLLASYNPETKSTARKESGSFYTPRPKVDYMVKESLFYYLKEKSRVGEEKLRILIETESADELSVEERRDLVRHLIHIKILDPACGSGAFPMGILQKMVRILNVLDPENRIYKEELQQKLKRELHKTIDRSDFEELRDNIEEVFANQLNDPDYARKLFLIQNCLYGVDIQSIAMQITKLRFFISLLVEQRIDPEKENLGIKPLPNLETKFVAANTLIGLNRNESGIRNLHIQDLEEELAQVREEYFGARTYRTKQKKRHRMAAIREEISELLIDDGWDHEMAHKISQWDPFDQNASNGWFDPEWMFGVGCFDVVIGNPPYIQLQKGLPGETDLKYGDLYEGENYQTFARTGDMYGLFYERGLQLTGEGGILCYITSNKWMRANYGKKLRKYFSNKNPLLLIDLGPGIFESATVDTNILLIRNRRERNHRLKAFILENKKQVPLLHEIEMTLMTDLSEDSWVILRPEEIAIKQKIEQIGTPLKDWDIDIYRGVLTGYNEAFIIDGERRRELIEQDPKSTEIIKPILRGRDIKRYKAEFADLYLLFIPWHFPLHEDPTVSGASLEAEKEFESQYPAIYHHLLNFKENLSKRNQAETGIRYEWYALQRCAATYYKEFEKEKIVFQEMVQESNFVYDTNDRYFCNDTGRIITGENLSFLIGILNSKFFFYSIKTFYGGGGLGSTGVRMKHTFFNKFHVPKLSAINSQPFSDKIEFILSKKDNGEDTMAEERKIDVMVYKLYQLTYEEVLIVDPEFWLSKDEYDVVELPVE